MFYLVNVWQTQKNDTINIYLSVCKQMFTNGMWESNIGEIVVRAVAPEPFLAMLRFMYGGFLDLEEKDENGTLLLPLLVLADRYAIQVLQQECCMRLLDCLTEVVPPVFLGVPGLMLTVTVAIEESSIRTAH